MAELGPFEARPRVAVAVSGGPDSLCLTLLLNDWVRSCGGFLLGLHVDHRLRAESGREAAWVATTLDRHGIACRILEWRDAAAGAKMQERARSARYGLLLQACAEEGILHLAIGHQADDQAETRAMRASRGAQLIGASGMADLRETRHLRLIRPLLSLPRSRLVASLRAHGQDWIEDPSNQSARFERSRLRVGRAMEAARPEDGQAGERRRAIEAGSADLLARHAELRPEGWAILDVPPLLAAPPAISQHALGSLLRLVGGESYFPALPAIQRLMARFAAGETASLHGTVAQMRGPKVIIRREWQRIDSQPLVLQPGRIVIWDGRFELALAPGEAACQIQALGHISPSAKSETLRQAARRRGLTMAILNGLPAIMREGGLVGTPALACAVDDDPMPGLACFWRPEAPLAGGGFRSPML